MESSKKRKRVKRRRRAPNENPKLSSKEETTPTAERANENEEENPKASSKKLRKSQGLVSNSSSFLAKVMNYSRFNVLYFSLVPCSNEIEKFVMAGFGCR